MQKKNMQIYLAVCKRNCRESARKIKRQNCIYMPSFIIKSWRRKCAAAFGAEEVAVLIYVIFDLFFSLQQESPAVGLTLIFKRKNPFNLIPVGAPWDPFLMLTIWWIVRWNFSYFVFCKYHFLSTLTKKKIIIKN